MTHASKRRNHIWHILFFFIFFQQVFPTLLNAQLNIKTGYSLSYAGPTVSSDLFNDFNTNNEEWLDQQIKELHWMHGIHLGLRYRIEDILGIELGWATRFDNTEGKGTNPANQELFYRKFHYAHNQLSFGLESIIGGRVGIGGSMNYDLMSIKSRHEEKGDKLKVMKDNNLSSNFFITYYTEPSNALSFAIRPYVRVPWTEINYSGLANDLLEETNTSALNDKSLHFGITLLFFNGN